MAFRLCSDEIGRVRALSYLGWVQCFLGCFLLYCRRHNWCLLISRGHIQFAWGQGHARSRVQWAISVAHFNRYISNCTAVLSLGIIVQSKTNSRFEIITYELTIYDPTCGNVIKGHPRSCEVTDLG